MPRPRRWTDDDLRFAVRESASLAEVCEWLDIKPGGGTYDALRCQIRRLGIEAPHLTMVPGRNLVAGKLRWTDDDLRAAVRENTAMSAVLRSLGYRPSGGMHRYFVGHIRRLELDTSHFKGQGWAKGTRRHSTNVVPLDQLLVRGSMRSGAAIRRRLVTSGLKEDRCEECGISAWLRQPLRLELHHVNGEHTDNRLENLRILCPNCHSVAEAILRRLRRRIPIGRENGPRTRSVRVRISPPAQLMQLTGNEGWRRYPSGP